MTSGDELIEALRQTACVVRSVTSSATDEARALSQLINAAEAALADRLAEIEDTKAHVAEDASTVTTWARRELRMDAGRTRRLIRAAATMRDLGAVSAAAHAGLVSFEHVNLFTFGLTHVGRAEVTELEATLLAVARAGEPRELKQVIDRFRSTLHQEALDQAWIAGMEKADFDLHAVPDGWGVAGFLPTHVGARFRAVLDSLSVPTHAGDTRTGAERRIDGLDRLLTRVLEQGLPTDGTVRPQIHVLVEAGTLKSALAPQAESVFTPTEPATLVGFGHIGPNLLAHLTCGADLIPILVDRVVANPTVLDVGRRLRDATPRQRAAIWVQQSGECATSHCRNTIDHAHHDRRWAHGGPTDLANLIGLCHRCHLHQHRHDALPRAG